MENTLCERIEFVIREIERGNPNVFAVRKKRCWAYTVDYILRGALIYGGRRGIEEAICFANENCGINYEIDDVLRELHLCEQDSERELRTSVMLWAMYYCLFVERMDKEEKDRYYVSWKMLASAWIALKLAKWYSRKDVRTNKTVYNHP